MKLIRRGHVRGPGWAWALFDASSTLIVLVAYVAPEPLLQPTLRALNHLDTKFLNRYWVIDE